MSEEKHLFHVDSIWTGTSAGDGVSAADWGGTTEYGVPAGLGGKPGRTNPEELLLNAVVSCYSITLALLLERKRLAVPRLEVSAEGEVVRQPDKTLKFAAIRLKPKVYLASDDEALRKSAEEMAHKAELYCPVSAALKGNVEITVSPEIVRA